MIIIFSGRTTNPGNPAPIPVRVNQGGVHVEAGVAHWAIEVESDRDLAPDVEVHAFRTIAEAEAWIIRQAWGTQ